MLLCLGLGTQFSIMETVTRTVVDGLHGRVAHRTVLSVTCASMLVAGLVMTCQGGMYILQLLDSHAGTFPALLTGLLEVLVIAWLYGVDRFLEDIRRMVGWSGAEAWYGAHRRYWSTMWRWVTPGLLLVILVASGLDYAPLSYGGVAYPRWANSVGWAVSGLSVVCIPGVMVAKLWGGGGWRVASKGQR